jgi:hypothetical protein
LDIIKIMATYNVSRRVLRAALFAHCFPGIEAVAEFLDIVSEDRIKDGAGDLRQGHQHGISPVGTDIWSCRLPVPQ